MVCDYIIQLETFIHVGEIRIVESQSPNCHPTPTLSKCTSLLATIARAHRCIALGVLHDLIPEFLVYCVLPYHGSLLPGELIARLFAFLGRVGWARWGRECAQKCHFYPTTDISEIVLVLSAQV